MLFENLPRAQQIIWAAGLFEGEGCFSLSDRGTRWGVQARLAMTDRDAVERFMTAIGIGAISAKQKRPNEKPVFEWYVNAAPEVLAVINLLRPYLCERRTIRADEVMAVARTISPHNGARTHCPQGHPYEGANLRLERRSDGGVARTCVECKTVKNRERARKSKGITPDRYRV